MANKAFEQSTEQEAIRYTLGYQDGFLDAKKLFERPQGEWVVGGKGTTHYYICSKCEQSGDCSDAFCRYCGAEMKGEQKL